MKGAGELTIASVLLVVMIGIPFFVSGLTLQQQTKKTIEYSTSDSALVAEAKVEKELFRDRALRELNYSRNTVATDRTVSWGSGIPSASSVRESYEDAIQARLASQSLSPGCSGPGRAEVEVGDQVRAEFAGDRISCAGPYSRVSLPLDAETLSVERAGFLEVASEAREAGRDVLEADENQIVGQASSSDCERSAGDIDRSDVRDRARQDARASALEQYRSMIDSALGSYRFSLSDVSHSVSGEFADSVSGTRSCRLKVPASEVEGRTCDENSDSEGSTSEDCTVTVGGEEYYYSVDFRVRSGSYTFSMTDTQTDVLSASGSRPLQIQASVSG